MEWAIRCFERWSETRVALYDHSGEFGLLLGPERFVHRHVPCRQAKEYDERRCIRFDQTAVARELWRQPRGLLKLCHGGLLEWVAPLFVDGRLKLILNAGWRCPPEKELAGYTLLADRRLVLTGRRVEADELEWIMEGLRQLAARLGQLSLATLRPPEAVSRQMKIHAFLLRRCREKIGIAELAAALHLSESRVVHVVREETGCGFRELLTGYRLRLAAVQLQASDQPVPEVASNGGFGDVANFHRSFKRFFGQTPLKYRRLCRKAAPPDAPAKMS